MKAMRESERGAARGAPLALAPGLLLAPALLLAQSLQSQWLPTGASITPYAVPGTLIQALNPGLEDYSGFLADHAVAEAQTSDGKTLLVLTSGYNRHFGADGKRIAADSNDYVFVFDVSGDVPRQIQVLPLPNAFVGLAIAPDDRHFFVAGGRDDDVHVYEKRDDAWREADAPIALGHPYGEGVTRSDAATGPVAAGLAVTTDGATVVVANFENDSLSIVDWAGRTVIGEVDLRPGKIDPRDRGRRGGTYPYAVAIRGSDTAYVSSVRDREIIAVDLAPAPRVRARIPVTGNPNRLVLNRAGTRLYVAEDNADRIAVIDTVRERLRAEWPLRLWAGGARIPERGLAPNDVALSNDERRLYVAAGGINAVAVVSLPEGRLRGFFPTGWYPTAVAAAPGDARLYILNGKSPEGPNAGNCVKLHAPPSAAAACPADRPREAANAYVLQLSKAALATVPVPEGVVLARLTRLTETNNRPQAGLSRQDRVILRALRQHVRHVIYVIKENRTYDQILGDLAVGNGDPALAQFPAAVTPNQHRLARDFVDLDEFYDSGEVSGSGWPWSVAGRMTEVLEKTVPPYYASRGFSYDSEGANRDVNVALATSALRIAANPAMQEDPDVLAGASDVAAPDGPEDEDRERGYLWDAALRRHLRVRNYGFFIDVTRYLAISPAEAQIPLVRDPAADGTIVAYPTNPTLAAHTDPYFRGFDNRFPDFYRYREWAREFGEFERQHSLPDLELVRFMHDHLGDFGDAADGVDTPERQVADNDYAVGLLIERVAHSRFARDTLIVVVEDDAQDGPDHVDAHRSVAFLAGPCVKHGAVVSSRYTTVDLVRTIELVLGLRPMNLHDALAALMSDAFDPAAAAWSYDAIVPAPLRDTRLPVPPAAPAAAAAAAPACPGIERDAPYWASRTADMNFGSEDRVDAPQFNRILWAGQRGDAAYPATRSGANLRADRDARLADWAQRCRQGRP